jgi:hypothetical protein
MKLNGLGVLLGLMLIFVLVFSASAPAALNGTSGKVTAAATLAAPPNAAPAEQHPQIHDAIAALRNARAHLEHAAHDFGGHRVDAIKATDEAIRQLEICLKYDKN